jgi:hypothetical protein
MSKRALLWGLGLLALAFAYVAAANVAITGSRFVAPLLGSPGHYESYSSCGGDWSPQEWFKSYCSGALPPRLGVLALGGAVLLVCAYYAEKNNPLRLPHHEVLLDESRDGLYWCRNCSFTSHDITAARLHKQIRLADGSSSMMVGANASGSGAGAAATQASSVLPQPPTAEFKTCPDCAEQVRTAARKCRFCGYQFSDVALTG